MKKIITLLLLFVLMQFSVAQELLANVNVNAQQIAGSNQSAYTQLERNVRDFINNTSWTGKTLENFEKIKCNFSFIITSRDGNKFSGSLVVQSVRPVYMSTYESPILNINDTKISFNYVENENLIYNERQFSGDNLTDIIGYYVFLVLGYDADTFQPNGGQSHFAKALRISQNSQNRGYDGWSQTDGPRSRGSLIDAIVNPNLSTMRVAYYTYHRAGLDNLNQQDQSQPKKIIADALLKLKQYENTFQQNYPINLFLDIKSTEIFNIFDGNNNGSVNMNELKQWMNVLSPKNNDSKWSKWK